MTLNILFFTITINKRALNVENAVHQKEVRELYEKYKERHAEIHHLL